MVSHDSYLRAAALALIIVGGSAPVAHAQDSTPTPKGAQQMAVEGLSKLMQALDMFVKSVPQYAAPEVMPNGDIIIRRVHPQSEPAPAPARPKSDDDATST